jgi:branched-chain amino acid transport system substrate-binding protein
LVARLNAGNATRLDHRGDPGGSAESETVVGLPSPDRRSPRRIRLVLAAAAAVVVLVAALVIGIRHRHDNQPVSPTPTTSVTATTAPSVGPLGPPQPATGSPVTVGYVSDGAAGADAGAAEIAAAQAAVRYINEHLGGIAGHPIALELCSTGTTASGATACAEQMIARNAVAVVHNISPAGATIEAGLVAAKIPTFGFDGAADHILTNAIGAGAVPIKQAIDQGVKSAGVVVTNGFIRSLLEPWFTTAGITTEYAIVQGDSTDIASVLQPMLAKNPAQVDLFVDSALCFKTLAAVKSLGYTGTIYVIPNCVDPSGGTRVPGGLAGVKEIANYSTDPNDPEVKLYNAVIAAYANGTNPDSLFTSRGYGAMLGLRRGLSDLTGDVTASSVRDALHTMTPQPHPLIGGATFQCIGTLVPGYSNHCTTAILVATLDAQGVAHDYQLVDVTGIVKA